MLQTIVAKMATNVALNKLLTKVAYPNGEPLLPLTHHEKAYPDSFGIGLYEQCKRRNKTNYDTG